jgi:hypothetical protein
MTTAQLGTTTPHPRLRLTLRGRRVVVALAAIPIAVSAFFGALGGGAATATDSSAELHYVSIEAGQSLWQLAESIAPTSDPRDVVSDILALNNLESSQLVPGQQLAVPPRYQP